MIGLPGETEATAQETIRYALTLGLATAQFSGAVPFPGTDFYNLCKREGWITATDWSGWLLDGEQSGIVEYPSISCKKINYYVDQGLKAFYFRFGYVLRFLLVNRSLADLYRKLRGAWNFLSYIRSR